MRCLVRSVVLLSVVVAASAAPAFAGPSDVWSVERKYADQLEQVGAAALLEGRGAPAADDPVDERLAHLLLLVRADRPAAADALGRLADGDSATLEGLGHWLIGHERWGLATRLMEMRPDLRLGWAYLVVQRMVEHDGFDAALAWVREREELAPDTWLPERVRLVRRHGGLEALLDEQAALVRAAPGDMTRVRRFVDLVHGSGITYDLEWVDEVVRTSGPLEDVRLSRLVLSYAPHAALALARRAAVRELGDVDRDGIRERWTCMAAFRWEEPDPDLLLRREARSALLDALRACGETDEAQTLMEELVAEAGTDAATGLPSPGWLETAGEIQAASGARVIEQAVRAAEEIGEDDPRYWLGRAGYFGGRGETDDVRQALERALELTADGSDDWHRRDAVHRMSLLIRHSEGDAAEARYLLAELQRCEESGGFSPEKLAETHALAHAIVRTLAFDIHRHADLVQPVCWRYLEAVPAIGHTAVRLLRRMAEDTPAERRTAFWDRCTALARRSGVESRERVGFAMIVTNDPERAIPFLRESVLALPEGANRDRCGFLVVRAGLESGDWRAVRDAWSVGRRHLGVDERPSRLARLALLAAQDGAPHDALDAWRRHTNHDAGALAPLVSLAEAGLRERLIAFYGTWAVRDPKSTAPARALAILRR